MAFVVNGYAEPPTRNVNVVNTPLPVTFDAAAPLAVEVQNPQTSVTVDNGSGNPVPVELQNPQTTVTINNTDTNPVPVTVQNHSTGPSQPQFVGFSSATFDGGQGVITYTAACQQAFPGSHMCTSAEFLNTASYPSVSGTGWIRPTYMPIGITDGDPGTRVAVQDISGVSVVGGGQPSGLACAGWNDAAAQAGLTVDSAGRFDRHNCINEYAVACCQ